MVQNSDRPAANPVADRGRRKCWFGVIDCNGLKKEAECKDVY